jgi:metal-dependent amidase/aminoacylase/carboxypeptidase family protein
MLQAFDRTEVQQGIEQLTNNAAVVFSAEIVDALNPERQTHVSLNSKPGSSGHTIGHNGQVINGQDREDGRPH